jgi:DNA-binding NarL/FixJ family response regulator
MWTENENLGRHVEDLWRQAEENEVPHITPGERAALQLLAEGKCRGELADSLEVSEPEVDARLMALFKRMGVETEREAAAECVKRGLNYI